MQQYFHIGIHESGKFLKADLGTFKICIERLKLVNDTHCARHNLNRKY